MDVAGRAQPLSWPAARHARPADLEDLAIDATPTPPPAPGPGGPDRLDLIDVHWERVQLVIRGRWGAGSDRTPVPAAVHLRRLPDHHGGDPTRGSDVARSATPMSMAPTGGRIDGDELLLRFNVMSGPDRMPLEPGSWRLEVAGRPLVVVATAGPPLPAASFVLARGEYVAAPHVDPGDGSFRLAVSLDPTRARPAGGGGLAAEPADAGGGGPLSPSRGGGGLAGWPRRIAGVARKTVFRALYRMARLVPRRGGRRVLFASDSRAELGGNLAVVWDRMIARGLDRRLDMRTLFKPGIAARRPLVDRLRLPWLLATSDVILIDDYLPIVYRIDDPKVRIIQLWHASGAFKTVGYSRVGKPGGPSPYSRIHKNYTYAIVSSDHDVPFYAEAFGIPEAQVVATGIPRMDRFFDEAAQARGREAAYAAFPASRDRFTILFAPTFRGETRSASYDMRRVDLAALHALAAEKDAVVIFKLHPFVREPLDIPERFRDRLLDRAATTVDVNDLLFIVDLLVTDYSSIVFEFSTLGRPMLFFAYDLDEYIAERDFYVPFEAFVPGRIVRTFDELLDAIRHDAYAAEKVPAFAARHFAHLDGSSTDRVIDQLVLPR